MDRFEQTLTLIKMAHEGQTDKIGAPYWWHPARVVNILGPQATEDDKLVALLHDVIEDTDITADDLREMGYGPHVVDAVVLLTRPEGMSYLEWIETLARTGSETAVRVKIADILDNLRPDRVMRLSDELRDKLVPRYRKALEILTETPIGT